LSQPCQRTNDSLTTPRFDLTRLHNQAA